MIDAGQGAAVVTAVRSISLTVANVSEAAAFYCEGLGFAPAGEAVRHDPATARLMGVADVRTTALTLRLGSQAIDLVAFEPRGRAYPPDRTASDPWFQHFAIVVADMDKAYAILRRRTAMTPISRGGPQKLPPNTGSVTAYKFRDPDGHPLELSFFPPGVGGAVWHQPRTGSVFLGIDHSAICVADVDRSIAFYSGLLGLRVTSRSLNTGPTQERLDGEAHDGVDIVTLQPGGQPEPHLELLGYRMAGPQRGALQLHANDIAATRLILRAIDLPGLAERLRSAGVAFVSPGLVTEENGQSAVIVRDPDGHLLQLTS